MIEKAPDHQPEDYSILERGFLNIASADTAFIKIEKDYSYWDKIKYLIFETLTPKGAWQTIKTKRSYIQKKH